MVVLVTTRDAKPSQCLRRFYDESIIFRHKISVDVTAIRNFFLVVRYDDGLTSIERRNFPTSTFDVISS